MNLIKKDLVSLAIEHTLLKKGGISLLDDVNYGLYKKFNSTIVKCDEHPEYLKKILQEIFGKDCEKITNSIVQELASFNYDDKVMRFIE
ncbi:MAG: hypothetical protein WCC55_02885, partial [Nitrosotalea sp.]